jgi:serine/threonine protein kinase
VERVLGEGGFGLVYLANDEQLVRRVVIKVPHRRLVSRPEDAQAYLAEARTVAGLDHAHIVPVYDVGSTAECPCFIVSKYIEGPTLAQKLKEDRPSAQEDVELVAAVAEALHYAHSKGLVHRDVKPGNILLDTAGKPHVADFGLALREENVGKGLRFAGTPAYMSPEQARGEGHLVDGRTDVFSLGVVLYELLTGRRPFRGDTREELLEQILILDPRPPRQYDAAIPKGLERICLKALAKRASERYSTAKDMAEDLRLLGNCLEVPAKSSLREPNQCSSDNKPKSRVRKGLLALLILGLIVATASIIDRVVNRPPVVNNRPSDRTTVTKNDNNILQQLRRERLLAQRIDVSLITITPTEKDIVEVYNVKARALGDKKGKYKNEVKNSPRVVVSKRNKQRRGLHVGFELQNKNSYPWIKVDEIQVVVHKYEPLPRTHDWIEQLSKPVEEPVFYHVEIENPEMAKTSLFSASPTRANERLAAELAGVMPGVFVRLKEEPQAFVLNIVPSENGIYSFSIQLLLSYKNETHTQVITRPVTIAFEVG